MHVFNQLFRDSDPSWNSEYKELFILTKHYRRTKKIGKNDHQKPHFALLLLNFFNTNKSYLKTLNVSTILYSRWNCIDFFFSNCTRIFFGKSFLRCAILQGRVSSRISIPLSSPLTGWKTNWIFEHRKVS